MARLAGVPFLLLICPPMSVHAQVTSAQAMPLEVQKLRPNLFLVTGGSPNTGGSATTVVFVRSTDVVVIDTKGPRPCWGEAIADEVKLLTKLPITTHGLPTFLTSKPASARYPIQLHSWYSRSNEGTAAAERP